MHFMSDGEAEERRGPHTKVLEEVLGGRARLGLLLGGLELLDGLLEHLLAKLLLELIRKLSQQDESSRAM